MCTVTFIPSGQNIYLTSNRDEQVTRRKALLTKPRQLQSGHFLIFPKDQKSGGSWIGLKNNRDAAVLLNGAFIEHPRQPPYYKSRGVVFLEIIETLHPVVHFRKINLKGIEPFTIILFTQNRLFECRWDGAAKYELELNANDPYIWSSVTLYDRKTRLKRQTWFHHFLKNHPTLQQNAILNFHRFAGSGDPVNDLLMNRENKIKTVSITTIEIGQHQATLSYYDLERDWKATKCFSYAKQTEALYV